MQLIYLVDIVIHDRQWHIVNIIRGHGAIGNTAKFENTRSLFLTVVHEHKREEHRSRYMEGPVLLFGQT
jgi:hypothetical protein